MDGGEVLGFLRIGDLRRSVDWPRTVIGPPSLGLQRTGSIVIDSGRVKRTFGGPVR